MIIKKLQLHNFGVYAGDNEFAFEGNKPIVLIGGMNGRGKTTFLEAVLLALYGQNSFAYSESAHKSYSGYLRSFVNRGASDDTCSVTLEFETNNGICENYKIQRAWSTTSKRMKEQISVYKDGEYNDFLTNNWLMFVENILPSALSSFFFFDGEQIAELAVDRTNEQLKDSIRSMLGITVLDVLSNDIMRNLKKVNKIGVQDVSAGEIQKLRGEKDLAREELKEADQKLEKASAKLLKDNDALESLHKRYTAKGGDVVNKRQELLKKHGILEAELSKENERLYGLTAETLPLLLVEDLLSEIKLQATDEHTSAVMQESVHQLSNFFLDFMSGYSGDRKTGENFLAYVKQRTEDNQVPIVYELSEQALFQVNNLVEGKLQHTGQEGKEILKKKVKIEKQIDELDSYLSLDINDQELQDIYKKIKKAEQKIIDDQIKLAELEQKRSNINARMIAATFDFNKRVEAYLATAEVRDSADRISKYSNMALDIIKRYRVELQKRKTDLLASTITECYLKLANKKNLIRKIEMDPETLDWKCLSEDESEIPRDSLSAGEKQLMVISILWALAICSKKKLPVIIDTPLSRMDSQHRTALITTYFPNAGEQTIILSTDSEIDEGYYNLMKDNIGDEFTLNYDEVTRSTSIQKGYLIGAKI